MSKNFDDLKIQTLEFLYKGKLYQVNFVNEALEKQYSKCLTTQLKGKHIGEGFAANRSALRIMTNIPEKEIAEMHQTTVYNIATWIFDEIFKSKKNDSEKLDESGKATQDPSVIVN